MSTFKPSKILIFGGTGAIGRYIVSALLSANPRPFTSLTLFTSPPSAGITSASASAIPKATLLSRWQSRGLSVIHGSVTSASDVRNAYSDNNIDTVISALGRGALEEQIPLLRLAEESESVKWFLPSEYGTDIAHGAKSAGEKPHQLKLKVRKFVEDEVRRVKVTYVVTGPYFDMWVDPVLPGLQSAGGFDREESTAWVVEDGKGKVGFCTMRDVGKFVAATLQNPETSFGKALKVQSFVVTPQQVLEEFERQTGAKWSISSISIDTLRALETKAWEEKNPKATPVTLRRIWAEGGTLYEKNDNEVVGAKVDDFDTLEIGVKHVLAGGWKQDEF